jgi:thiol-disulfide isomerase/thioredoxin
MPADVDVDTPRLRQLKRQVGMEPCPRVPDAPHVDGGMPALTVPCLGGGPDVDLAALRGPLVVNVWQSFCQPCIKEMPALQEFHERHREKVAVLGIDYQDTRPEAALELARRTGATYPSVADPGGEVNGRDDFPVLRGVPYFVLVDAEGRIAQVELGGVDEVEEIEAMVEEHLGVAL